MYKVLIENPEGKVYELECNTYQEAIELLKKNNFKQDEFNWVNGIRTARIQRVTEIIDDELLEEEAYADYHLSRKSKNLKPETHSICNKLNDINEYQKLALRTATDMEPENLILNGALGLSGESGEVTDVVKKYMFQGHGLNEEKIIEELGDVCWYIAIMSEGLGVDLETVMQLNIDKLRNRYPEGFDSEKSINRKG